jgi:diguanylate cyclase (GGDEF)-like protein
MARLEKKQIGDELLARIHAEIIPLFGLAISDHEVIFVNPHLPKCWEVEKCEKYGCPIHGHEQQRCWQVAGTFCGGGTQGDFVDKYSSCVKCDVFKKACPSLVEELGEQLNNMLFLLRKQRRRTLEEIGKIGYLNRELTTSLESLDAKNREIQEMVITDTLTGLYNRHYLFTVLEDEVARCYRGTRYTFSMLMMDVDNFKAFNDTYGHPEGDRVLSSFGKLLKEVLRKSDRAFRYGGEEFVVILPDTDQTIAYIIGERIRCAFSERAFLVGQGFDGGGSVFKTVSVGIACHEPGLDGSQLLARADEAMYQAKSRGRDQTVRYGEGGGGEVNLGAA